VRIEVSVLQFTRHWQSGKRAAGTIAILALTGCTSARFDADDVPTYRQSIGALLGAKCARCHAGSAPPAGWRADSYETAIGCVSFGRPVLEGPLVTALARPDHVELVTPEERTLLERWSAAGGPSVRPGTHDRAFLDPRSPDGHGNFLRARRYRPMLAADDADACGRCHDGVVAKPNAVSFAAPGATSCTSCHREAGGALACSTCHGSNAPRDPCFHPDAADDRAHPAHVAPSTSREAGLPCSTCHPQPQLGDLASPGGTHVDGHVEIWFDFAIAGRDAAFEAASKKCTGTCHAHGGNRAEPTWTEAAARPLACNDCHQSPPPSHYQGPCTSCHREADATGTKLSSPKLHVNGRADLGDGSGRCGACHGAGDDPWPRTGAHAVHAAPSTAKPVACETCHDLPSGCCPLGKPRGQHPLGKPRATVRLLGLANSGGHQASFDAASLKCSETYCHGGRGASAPAPLWNEGASARACGACHGSPPPPPHPSSTTCEGCHPTTAASTHLDGLISR
jgi:predicted CxxxxCH...CXXCH cytochrome family protein